MDDGKDIFAGVGLLILVVFIVAGIVTLITGIFQVIAWLVSFLLSIWYVWGSVIVLGFIVWLISPMIERWQRRRYRRVRYQTTTRQISALFAEGEKEMWRIKQQYEDQQFGHRNQKYLEGR
jgi:hypothetical protein